MLAADQPIYHILFDPRDRYLVAWGISERATVWELSTLRMQAQLEGPMRRGALSSDGALLATGGLGHVVQVWDPSSGQLLRTIEAHDNAVTELRFAADGSRLLTTSDDGTTRIWEVAAGRLLALLESRGTHIWYLDVDRDGALAATTGIDGEIRIWDIRRSRLLFRLPGHPGGSDRAVFSPDGSRILSGGLDGRVMLWDVGRDQRTPEALADLVRCRVPFRLEDDTALPAEPDRDGCL